MDSEKSTLDLTTDMARDFDACFTELRLVREVEQARARAHLRAAELDHKATWAAATAAWEKY
jgi:hypothetical protein